MGRDFEYQCEGFYGLTGSGKTTFAVKRAFDFIARGFHVYTNIHLNESALRHHALRRIGCRLRCDGEGDAALGRVGQIPRLHRCFHHIDADDVAQFWRVVPRGPAVVIIDEAQLWFPQLGNAAGGNRMLVRYLTQHRKLKHHVWFISQFPTLVAHDFRKIQHLHWEVKNTRHQAINLGLFSVRVPFEGFTYVCSFRDEKGPRVDTDMILASAPSTRWLFDLFESRELHAGLGDVISNNGITHNEEAQAH